MQFELTKEEIGFVMGVLGELPSKSGAYMLLVKLQKQIEAQSPAAEAKE